MHYTLHQLKVFLKVAEHQSITRASEDLFLTQPAVSIQLKKFQEFLSPLTTVKGLRYCGVDIIETTNSGALVPNATTVRPIKRGVIPTL